MKPGAILVNTARAQLVDENAFVAAVESKRIIAALDVFYHEPLLPSHPLHELPNVVLTPHLGTASSRSTGVLPAKRRECVGLPGRQADPRIAVRGTLM
jgi:phosphoglycerate dehydrogenase-like enzyme